MLTAGRKASIKSFLQYELEVCILNDRRAEVRESSSVEQDLQESESGPKRTKLEKFLVIAFKFHQKKSVLQRQQKQSFKDMN